MPAGYPLLPVALLLLLPPPSAHLLRLRGGSRGVVQSMSLNQCRKPARVSTKWQQPQLLVRGFHKSTGPCRMMSGLQNSSCDSTARDSH